MSEVSMTAGGYRYRGTLTDQPVLRGRPGRRRGPLAIRVLEVLADLGGEASTTEIRRALEASGMILDGRRQGTYRVPDTLHRLARTTPPEVTPAGSARGGQGNPQRWRLLTGGRQ